MRRRKIIEAEVPLFVIFLLYTPGSFLVIHLSEQKAYETTGLALLEQGKQGRPRFPPRRQSKRDPVLQHRLGRFAPYSYSGKTRSFSQKYHP